MSLVSAKRDQIVIPPRAVSVSFHSKGAHNRQTPQRKSQMQRPSLPSGKQPDFGNGGGSGNGNGHGNGNGNGKGNQRQKKGRQNRNQKGNINAAINNNSGNGSGTSHSSPALVRATAKALMDDKVPPIQALPSGKSPDFGSMSNFAMDKYAGSSFSNEPKAVTLKKPSFLKK
ncbi:hypothetical protein DAMA08_001860 [Martiniozyma asiatica (nom. inval.)]|nr:hypothetical protein DAMA08_001860 [Martiniozyma asiatica]